MIKVNGVGLKGDINAIPSKSYAHRALIAAALSDAPSKLIYSGTSDDIDVTIQCLKELGSDIIPLEEGGVLVNPIVKKDSVPVLDVGESGSTFRFLLPVAASLYEECSFIGRGRLPERPISDLMNVMKTHGVSFSSEKLPFTTCGILKAGVFELPGDVSSQYISGLLLAGPLLEDTSKIKLKTELESKPYVDITIEVLSEFGVDIKSYENSYTVNPKKYNSGDYKIEGDWSNAAFFMVAGLLGEGIRISGLKMDSAQGDKAVVNVLKNMGGSIKNENEVLVCKHSELSGTEIDLKEIPDSLPILAVAASSVVSGVTKFYNIKRLRLKESDRVASVAKMIEDLGGKVKICNDELYVYGTDGLKGGVTESFRDHRLVMAASIASMISSDNVTIKNPGAVTKSYPTFFEDFEQLGGVIIDGDIR